MYIYIYIYEYTISYLTKKMSLSLCKYKMKGFDHLYVKSICSLEYTWPFMCARVEITYFSIKTFYLT